MDDPLPPIEGEILRMDDRDTGFSPNNPKEGRPYVVVGLPVGRRVRVVPQSTIGDRGVFVSDGVVDGVEAGRFVPWSTTLRVAEVQGCELVGYLPRGYVDEVKEQMRPKRRQPE